MTSSPEFQPIVVERHLQNLVVKMDDLPGYICLADHESQALYQPRTFTPSEALATADALRAAALFLDPALAPPVGDTPELPCNWENEIEHRLAEIEQWVVSVQERAGTNDETADIPSILAATDIGRYLTEKFAALETQVAALEARPHYFIGVDQARAGSQDLSIATIIERHGTYSELIAAIPILSSQDVVEGWAATITQPAASGDPERKAVLPFIVYRVNPTAVGVYADLWFFDGVEWHFAWQGEDATPWTKYDKPLRHDVMDIPAGNARHWIVPPDTVAGDKVVGPETELQGWVIHENEWGRWVQAVGDQHRQFPSHADRARATLAIESATTKGEAHILLCHWLLNRAGAEAAR